MSIFGFGGCCMAQAIHVRRIVKKIMRSTTG